MLACVTHGVVWPFVCVAVYVCVCVRGPIETRNISSLDRAICIYIATLADQYQFSVLRHFFLFRNSNISQKNTRAQEAKAELFEFTHPDPYCVPYMPGGSLFMRNPPPPLEICFPDGDYPDDAPRHTMNLDMTISRVETGKSAVGGVLVDFGKKNME